MKCATCSAPLPPNKSRCQYCGTVTDVDLSGKHHFTTNQPTTPRPCCGCGKIMATVNVGTEDAPFYIERCSDCLGLFFDPGELDSFVDHTIRSVFSINQLALASMSNVSSSEVVRYRKCPVCSKLMNRINFGKSSGVIVDQCQDHGIYLDAGELHRILAWVRLGGKLRAQANTDAETEAASRTVAQARKYLDQPSSTYQPGMENAPETMVSKVTDFLIKIMGNT